MISKNIVIGAEMLPIIGEDTKYIKEISKRFAKYYRKGIKKENRKKLLGYTMFVPKALSKFEAKFIEDKMILEVKVNKTSSILIPSFYTSIEVIKELFDLEVYENKLKNVYSLKEGKYVLNNNFIENKINEVRMADTAGAGTTKEPFKPGIQNTIDRNKKLPWYKKLYNTVMLKGRAKDIKSYAKDFLIKFYPEKVSNDFLRSIVDWGENPPFYGKKVASVMKYAVSPIANLLMKSARAIKGNKNLTQNANILVAQNENEFKLKTATILKKIFKEGESSEKFIKAAVSIFDDPNNIAGWLKRLEATNAYGLLKEEEEIFNSIVTTFRKGLNFGGADVPKDAKEGRALQNQEIVVKGVDKQFWTHGAGRIISNGFFKRILRSGQPNKNTGFSFDVDDVDALLMQKVKMYTEGRMPKEFTSEQNESGMLSFFKECSKIVLPIVFVGCTVAIITGISPVGSAITWTATHTEHSYLSHEYSPKAVNEKAKEIKRLKAALEKANSVSSITDMLTPKDVCQLIEEGEITKKWNGYIIKGKYEKENFDEKSQFLIESFSRMCVSDSEGGQLKIDSEIFREIYFAIKDGKELKNDSKFIFEGISKHYFNNVSIEDVRKDKELKKTIGGFFGIAIFRFKGEGNDKTSVMQTAMMAQENNFGVETAVNLHGIANSIQSEFDDIVSEIKDMDLSSPEKVEAEAKSNAAVQSTISAGNDVIKKIKPKLISIGEMTSKRLQKTFDKDNAWLTAILKLSATAPVDCFIAVGATIEEELRNSGEAESFAELQSWIENEKNLTRLEAALFIFMFAAVLNILRISGPRNLTKRIEDLYKEMITRTNIFRAAAVQIVIETIQLVCWASCHEDFRVLMKNQGLEDENNKPNIEDPSIWTNLTNNLNNVVIQKEAMSSEDVDKLKKLQQAGVVDEDTASARVKLSLKYS